MYQLLNQITWQTFAYKVECLYDFSFNSVCPYMRIHSFTSIFLWLVHQFIHHVLFFLWLSLSKSILVGLDDALEVGVESEKDSSLEENLEEVVLLLELLVLVF